HEGAVMSSPFLEPPGGASSLRQRTGSSPFLSPSFSAPVLPPTRLTQPVTQNLSRPNPVLSDLALGQASQLLDAVRDRKVDWKRAKELLDPLSAEDKKTLASVREGMSEDEKRALGMSSGGGNLLGKVWDKAIDYSPLGLGMKGLGAVGSTVIGDNAVGNTVSNFAGDVSTLVK